MAREKDTPCAQCGTLIWRPTKGQPPPGVATCRACWRPAQSHCDVVGTRLGRDWHRHRNEDLCDPCRIAWNEISRKRQTEAAARGWVRSRSRLAVECVGCGKAVRGAYKKESPWHRACRERAEAAERRRTKAAERLVKAAAGATGWRSVWVEGPCNWCGTRFCSRSSQPAKYCSDRCSNRAKRRGFKIRPAERLAIYDRDGWTCQLCTEPVDRDLMTTDPLNDWAPSLDHIEPQSWALIPDHSPENLRLAHRWCNSVRGDLTYYDDSVLRAA